MTKQICPTCGLAPAPIADMLRALDAIAAPLARLEAAGHLTRRQRSLIRGQSPRVTVRFRVMLPASQGWLT